MFNNPEVTRGIPDAAARLNPVAADRLVPFNESCDFVGLRSRTSLYKLIADGELPEPITRGRNRYFLESDLLTYLGKLSAQRGTTQQNIQHAQRLVEARVGKRAQWECSQRSEGAT